ncbi:MULTISPECIES: RNA polymerase sigma factor [Halomonas]|uniref:RNA polymerase sigma factor n=2 Tax=Halomonas TaxID=2745 RepID=A0A7X5ALW4_9GAMM|nr:MULTISPECIES: RNA polymerase sigma factor [Halomonas]MDR5902350.1 RNA polymerase sigma factor [Halomonas icarae]NAW12825.1 RNA polymerase sigma factor [Halomonas icarae]TDA95785.1 RNA polymerase sigma factor [Halomonas marinisediminis]
MTYRLRGLESPERLVPALAGEAESELVARARHGDEAAVRELVRRFNPRLFRVARGLLDSDAAAEEAVQEAYVAAFTRLDTFRGTARFSTWLTRIVINQARMQWRRRRPLEEYDTVDEGDTDDTVVVFPGIGPEALEAGLGRREFRALLEEALDELAPEFRLPFLMHEVEGMGVFAIARDLGINPATIKTRLFRARRKLRARLEAKMKGGFGEVFPFDGARCAGMAGRVVERLVAAGQINPPGWR